MLPIYCFTVLSKLRRQEMVIQILNRKKNRHYKFFGKQKCLLKWIYFNIVNELYLPK
jgi:hypothetical protein